MRAVAKHVTGLSLLLLLAGGLASADVWRWVDSTGRVHYSDVPVDGAVRIKSAVKRPEPSSSGFGGTSSANAQQTLASRSVAITERVEGDAASRAVQGDLARKRAEQCKEATERYDRSIAARRLFREGKGGERVYLTEAELSEARVQARRDRDTACGAATAAR